MKLSTTTSSLFRTFGEEGGMRIAKEVGFDALDLNLIWAMGPDGFGGDDYREKAMRLRELSEQIGIPFNQAHAPFPTMRFLDKEARVPDAAYNEKAAWKIRRALEIAGIVGAPIIVVHPVDFLWREDQKEENIKVYESFAEDAARAGVKIALENMWGLRPGTRHIVPNVCSTGRELGEYYDALNPERFAVCLDLGHIELIGENAEDAIYELGHGRLHALHVHDNGSVIDDHAIPYFGVLRWEKICRALADVDYAGDFTFEVNGDAFIRLEKEPTLAKDAYRLLADTGKNLIAKIEKYRKEK